MIYFVRHGSTDWNLNKDANGNIVPRCQGWADIPINEVGKGQAQKIAEELKNIKFDKVFCSPLTRAKQTCEIITRLPYEIDNRIIERNFGEFEGLMHHEFDFKGFLNPKNDGTYISAEDVEPFMQRVFSFLDKLKKYKNKNILVVSHGAVAVTTMVYFLGRPDGKNLDEYIFPNGTYKVFNYSCEYDKQ